MSSATASPLPWAERAADRSPVVQRSRARQIEQAEAIIEAARRLIAERGARFTTQELVKEAGVALQTFYRLFAGKDQLLLAVFEDMIAENCAAFEEAARELPDPVARLRFYVTEALHSLGRDTAPAIGPQFVTAEHWRLYQLFPAEMSLATQPFTDIVARELTTAAVEGWLTSADPQRDAWFVTNLVMAVFHHYAFADPLPDTQAIGDELWSFCCRALGGERAE
ncbi:MAG TPA: helix-turn-helix domain-containing protein [Acidimicrobiia bacterium]|nr:helix-turn-helix domain-containing protein [Acidimicrobiia bacterium]